MYLHKKQKLQGIPGSDSFPQQGDPGMSYGGGGRDSDHKGGDRRPGSGDGNDDNRTPHGHGKDYLNYAGSGGDSGYPRGRGGYTGNLEISIKIF